MDSKPEIFARRSVLYVEDHAVNVVLMSALLEQRPHLRLVVATTGQEALSIARGLAPDLLLLDLRLPDCHGSRLLPLLRQLSGCDLPPAVAVTAEGDFEVAGSGFDELWAKPLDMQHVLARLDVLVPTQPWAARAAGPGDMAGERQLPSRRWPAERRAASH